MSLHLHRILREGFSDYAREIKLLCSCSGGSEHNGCGALCGPHRLSLNSHLVSSDPFWLAYCDKPRDMYLELVKRESDTHRPEDLAL